MIGTSTKFNKIGDKKRRKPPIHLTTYRGWGYSWLRRWIKKARSSITKALRYVRGCGDRI